MNKSVVKLASGVAALSMWAGVPFAAYATGSWSTAVDVSASGFLTSDPEIAIDADGLMIAVWSHVGVSTKTIQVSTSSDGQGWTSPVDISPISHEAIQPHLVVDRTGQATVIWTNTSGTDSIWASKREWGETTWSTPVRLSVEAEETGQAQIVVDSNGAFTTIFNNWDAHKIQVRTSDDGVTWDAIVTVAQAQNSQYLRNPQIAVDGAGRVTGIWEAYDAGGDAKMIASRSSTNPGVWTDATTLISGDASGARIASTESGLTTVAAFSDFQRWRSSHEVLKTEEPGRLQSDMVRVTGPRQTCRSGRRIPLSSRSSTTWSAESGPVRRRTVCSGQQITSWMMEIARMARPKTM